MGSKVIIIFNEWVEDTEDLVLGGCYQDVETTYEDVVMHQVSHGMIQMVFETGDTLILTSFEKIKIIPDEEAREKFLAQVNPPAPEEPKASNDADGNSKGEKITSITK